MKLRIVINKLRFYSSFLLLAFYIVVGILFLFTDIWEDLLPKSRFAIGIILILFGVFRFYVAYRRYLNKNNKLQTIATKKNETKE
jgi:cytochrome c biogenesis protein CcdA